VWHSLSPRPTAEQPHQTQPSANIPATDAQSTDAYKGCPRAWDGATDTLTKKCV